MATTRKTKAKKTPAARTPKAKAKSKAAQPKRATAGAKMTAGKAAKSKTRPKAKAGPKAKADAKTPTRGQTGKKRPAKKQAAAAVKTKEPAPAKAARKPTPPKARPRKPAVDPELLKKLREALVAQRRRLQLLVQSAQAQMAAKIGDLADVIDRASEGYGDELAVGLIAIEAAQLDEIEAAIQRIDQSTYGLCIDCQKPIPRKRLEVLPFARRCLACTGKMERGVPSAGTFADEEG